MKKKTVLYIFITVAVVLAILIITEQLPPAPEDDSAGTIGKVNKYRKVQMTEKDIILRSEFTKDRAVLEESIKGLILFNVFAKDYAAQLKKWTNNLEQSSSPVASLNALKDYYSFLNKNVPSVENTIEVLTEYYTGDTTEMSLDVEKKLSDFYLFASQLFIKDSVINQVIPELQKTISKQLVLNDERDEEMKKLKEIHDQMLFKTLQVALLTGNKKSVDTALKGTLYNSSNLQGISLESKNSFRNINLGTFIKNNLGPLHYSQTVLNPALFSEIKLGPLAQEKLGPAAASHEKLGPLSQEKLGPLSQEKLGPLSQEKLGPLSQEKLGPIMSIERLGPVVFAFGDAIMKNTASLGPVIFSGADLQSSIKSSLGAGLNSKLENTPLMNMDKLGPL